MSDLLSSFEICGFRAFEYLSLERLGRVNLIVGKNNVGKTSLLEALWVYANRGAPPVLWSLLEGREESRPLIGRSPDEEDIENLLLSLRYLFYGRNELTGAAQAIRLGPLNSADQSLSIKFTWVENFLDEKGTRRQVEVSQPGDAPNARPALKIAIGPVEYITGLERRSLQETFAFPLQPKCAFLQANGFSPLEISRLWDNITLGDSEEDVLAALQLVEPGIERINLVGSYPNARAKERIAMVKRKGLRSPLPLRSLGEGVNRIFGISLALANAKDGLLLVDEIENGLHYSIHQEAWRFILDVAHKLNVQVFAATHSWDCVTAFQRAAQASQQDGLVIRLENKKDKILPTIFDKEDKDSLYHD